MFYGPHVCGEAVDMCGNEILTGSWRPEDQLEIWDFSTAKKITGKLFFSFDLFFSRRIFGKSLTYAYVLMINLIFLCKMS